MRILTLALNTWESFVHNRLIMVVLILSGCIILLMMFPLMRMRAYTNSANQQMMEGAVLDMIAGVMGFVSGLGSLLAAWGAADAYNMELKSGTVLAVMARPVRRWEFLAGKYAGVMLLMASYVLLMFFLSYLLAWIGGEHFHTTPWVLLLYPLVRYAIYAAVAMLLATFVSPVVAMGIVLAIALLIAVTGPGVEKWGHNTQWLKIGLYYVLPSTRLLSEDRFLIIKQASTKATTALDHLVSLGYGAEYAAILVLLAIWSFHYRTLRRD